MLYDCDACEKNPGLKIGLGHDGPPQQYWKKNLITGEQLNLCPLRTLLLAPKPLLREVRRHVDEYYPHYQNGHLLVAGGVAQQPARYLAFMAEIDRLWAKVDEKFAKPEGDEGSSEDVE